MTKRSHRAFLAAGLMMVLFLHAARIAMITFDPYLSSRPIADALKKAPPGQLIIDHHYYTFSSVFFYLDTTSLLLNGRYNNLEYGAAAPDAPPVFIDDAQFSRMWQQPERYYIVAMEAQLPRFEKLIAPEKPIFVISSGGKFVLTNHPLNSSVENASATAAGFPQKKAVTYRKIVPGS